MQDNETRTNFEISRRSKENQKRIGHESREENPSARSNLLRVWENGDEKREREKIFQVQSNFSEGATWREQKFIKLHSVWMALGESFFANGNSFTSIMLHITSCFCISLSASLSYATPHKLFYCNAMKLHELDIRSCSFVIKFQCWWRSRFRLGKSRRPATFYQPWSCWWENYCIEFRFEALEVSGRISLTTWSALNFLWSEGWGSVP